MVIFAFEICYKLNSSIKFEFSILKISPCQKNAPHNFCIGSKSSRYTVYYAIVNVLALVRGMSESRVVCFYFVDIVEADVSGSSFPEMRPCHNGKAFEWGIEVDFSLSMN